ncbi:(E,E)-geranyllinalool synthase-like [Durio zibethinus]|uniref:(E,E)-geranyllinalool synthase-like n=1 Tax=Durio zibethinus TaxID=66656 RepID=A0A6P6BJR6_DURZI|nr:(E,E)-geranyllinalool synthase-like [Durio zibethinus]
MEHSNVSIQALVKEITEEMLSDIDPYSFVSPSAYDTAWLAMIPNLQPCPVVPMFKDCLDWVLKNQTEEGYWGECDAHGNPTIESLPATLACVIALKKWNVGIENAQRGLAFIRANIEKLLGENPNQFPRWFAIVFPGMIEFARKIGLELDFPNRSKGLLMDIFFERQEILETEELTAGSYRPLLSYVEALPSFYAINQEDITMHLRDDGSLFQSPSATARAFMATGKKECLAYLQSLVRTCTNGVPSTYPMDEELIKLGLANQIQRLGLAEQFGQQIEDILTQAYWNYNNQASSEKPSRSASVATQLHKDSLAFRLLRMHGYDISPWSFCWFLNNQEILDHIEKNHEYFSSVLLNVYRATDLMFPGEYELEEARSFSRRILEKAVPKGTGDDDHFTKSFNLQRMIEHELSLPWVARLDHLEHRAWIEEKDMNALWAGKTSFHRLSSLKNEKFVQLAVADYEFRQSIYKNEIAELKSWCLKWGLSDMGFGREKTMYCYFAVSASISLPYDSDIRMMIAKSAILITVADDFFDMEASLNELNILTDAVRRWDAAGLSGHSKAIFDGLDNLVKETAGKHLQQHGTDITSYLQKIWCETFASWLVEATWSKSGYLPSMDEYLGTGMTSIAAHTLVLPASCRLKSSLPNSKINPAAEYETVTKLVMLIPRLLNDIQSYQKEIEDGKMNYVLLYMKENPDADIDDSIAFVRDLLEKKRKELLKHALMDGFCDLPVASRRLHLSCMKVFQMFFNSSNRYDSNTEMLQDIQKAIYIPLDVGTSKPLMPLSSDSGSKKGFQTITSHLNFRPLKYHNKRIIGCQTSLPIGRPGYAIKYITPNFRLSFA